MVYTSETFSTMDNVKTHSCCIYADMFSMTVVVGCKKPFITGAFINTEPSKGQAAMGLGRFDFVGEEEKSRSYPSRYSTH